MILEFKQFLIEGNLDWETTQISRVIIDNIKRKQESILEMPGHGYYQFTLNKDKSSQVDKLAQGLGFYISGWGDLKVPDDLLDIFPNMLIYVGIGDPIHRGFYERKSNVLFVQVEIPKTENKLDYNAIIPYLKSILRHELEHSKQDVESPYTKVKQYGWEDVKDKAPSSVDFSSPDLIEKYYTHPSEIEAWVSGLYKHAKTAKQPFQQILGNHLNRIALSMEKRGIDPVVIHGILDRIREKYLAYAKFRFPTVAK